MYDYDTLPTIEDLETLYWHGDLDLVALLKRIGSSEIKKIIQTLQKDPEFPFQNLSEEL